jgi:hypothetical protein
VKYKFKNRKAAIINENFPKEISKLLGLYCQIEIHKAHINNPIHPVFELSSKTNVIKIIIISINQKLNLIIRLNNINQTENNEKVKYIAM